MIKQLICTAALLLPLMASAGNPPASTPPAGAKSTVAQQPHALPQAMQQTSRAAAMKAMNVCQQGAAALKGADKEQSIQACMRSTR